MEKKEIQEQRMRMYFIEATKDLLKGEGLKSVSVRSIADRAGYSFGTLYNYFKDINDLIFLCVKDFQEECEQFVDARKQNSQPGIESVKKITKAYVEYFIEYPGIFELFFLERMSGMGNKQPTAELIYTFLDRLCAADWDTAIKDNMVSAERAEKAKNQLRFATAGLLLYFNNRRIPGTYAAFVTLVEEQLDLVFNDLNDVQL